MKKITLLLLTVFLTSIMAPLSAWAGGLTPLAAAQTFAGSFAVQNVTLDEALVQLSQHSGLRFLAVPEVAGLKVDLKAAQGETVEDVLENLLQAYGLTLDVPNGQNVIVIRRGYYQTRAAKAAQTAAAEAAAKGVIGYGDGYQNRVGKAVLYDVPGRMIAPLAAYNPSPGHYPPPHYVNADEYKKITDNRYQNAIDTPLSTFAIDVDTASYSNLRRYINSGKLPPADAVRTEEMLNYFKYDYGQPQNGHPFSVTTELGDCPWNSSHKLLLVGLQGKDINPVELPPSNLVFLIDVSGSMSAENRLPLLKTAFKMLVKQLREQDRVSIVVYASQVGVVLEPTSGSDKEKINAVIDSLQAGGSTNGGDGIQLAYKMAKRHLMKEGNNRVILATDGDFNVGVTNDDDLLKLIEKERNSGIYLSVLGFGMGNLKDGKMEMLADKGHGNYAYIDNALEAKKVMVTQFAGTMYAIAKDVKLQLEFNPAKVKSYRLIGYENRVMDKADFNNDKKEAGDMGAGHAVTALYEIIPAGSEENGPSINPLIYQQSKILPSTDLLQIKIRYKRPEADTSTLLVQTVAAENATYLSDNFRFAAAVAEYAMLVRNSEYKGSSSYQQVLKLARGARGYDEEGYRGEFIRMVELSEIFIHKE